MPKLACTSSFDSDRHLKTTGTVEKVHHCITIKIPYSETPHTHTHAHTFMHTWRTLLKTKKWFDLLPLATNAVVNKNVMMHV